MTYVEPHLCIMLVELAKESWREVSWVGVVKLSGVELDWMKLGQRQTGMPPDSEPGCRTRFPPNMTSPSQQCCA